MKTVYIDYTSSAPLKNLKHHGVGAYTNTFLLYLQKKPRKGYRFVLIWPDSYQPRNSLEDSFYSSGFYKVMKVNSLSDVNFERDSTLFLAGFSSSNDVKGIHLIKRKNPSLTIIGTVHDVLTKVSLYEPMARYYRNTPKWKRSLYFIHKPRMWIRNNILASVSMKHAVKVLDKIFVNSNFTLRNLVGYKPSANIIPHYLTTFPRESVESTGTPKEKYFLFVSGDRPLKNFLRTLEAFCKYKSRNKDNYYMYVTGVTEELLELLLRYKQLSRNVVKTYVRPLGYVDDAAMDSLYRNASLLVYTSRYEGFGLPLIEAARRGVPALSSYAAAIPEVLGSGAYYVNPMSVQSITDGMLYMSQSDVLSRYKRWIKELYPILERKMKLDMELTIQKILE